MDFIEKLIRKWNEFFTARKILFFGICAGFIFMLFYMIFCSDMYRDVAFCYARYAREFGEGNWNGRAIFQLPPLHIFLGGLLVKCGIPAYGAVITVSAFFYLAMTFPLYFLLKRFMTERLAAFGCVLFLFAPRMIRFSGMALLEPARDFFLILAVWMIFRLLDEPRKWRFAAFAGAAIGGMMLARGEGCVMALLLLLITLVYLIIKCCREKENVFKNVIMPCVVLLFALLLSLSPRLIETWRLSGYPVPDGRILRLLQVESDLIPRATEQQRQAAVFIAEDAVMDGDALGTDIHFDFDRVRDFLSNVSRGAYELYLFLAVVGTILLLKRKDWRWEYTFIWAFILLILPGFYKICYAYRYFVFMIPLLMVFSLTGLTFFAGLLKKRKERWLQPLCLALFAAILIVQASNAVTYVFRKDGREIREAVAWLRENRQRFLFEGQTGRLEIYSPYDNTVVFLAGEEVVPDFGDIPVDFETCKTFNAVIVPVKLKDVAERFRQDPDMLVEKSFPIEEFIFFRPAARKNLPAPAK